MWPRTSWMQPRLARTSEWQSCPSSASSHSSSTSLSRTRYQWYGWEPWLPGRISLNVQVFSKQLVEKVQELDSQKNQTEKAFHGFLPPALVRDMKREQVKHKSWSWRCHHNDSLLLLFLCSPSLRSLTVSPYSMDIFLALMRWQQTAVQRRWIFPTSFLIILLLTMELIDFMNVLYGNLEDRFKKFQVYNVPTMGADDFMVLFLFFFSFPL